MHSCSHPHCRCLQAVANRGHVLPIILLPVHVSFNPAREPCSSLVVRPLVRVVHDPKLGAAVLDTHVSGIARGVAQCVLEEHWTPEPRPNGLLCRDSSVQNPADLVVLGLVSVCVHLRRESIEVASQRRCIRPAQRCRDRLSVSALRGA